MNREEIKQKIIKDLGQTEVLGEAIGYYFFDTILPEVLRDMYFNQHDIQWVGDHYWGGDYSPSYRELFEVSETMNLKISQKAKEKYNITL